MKKIIAVILFVFAFIISGWLWSYIIGWDKLITSVVVVVIMFIILFIANILIQQKDNEHNPNH